MNRLPDESAATAKGKYREAGRGPVEAVGLVEEPMIVVTTPAGVIFRIVLLLMSAT
jgi:hypothetical protein